MIDCHVHFWKLDRGDYTWLTSERPNLFQDYLPEQFPGLSDHIGVDGCIAIQAAPTESETNYLLDLADSHEWILGVIGWSDLTSPKISQNLTQLSSRSKFKGVRPMAGVQNSSQWLDLPEYQPGFKALASQNLILEALSLPVHLNGIASVAKRHGDLQIVINHAAKPMPAEFTEWAANIRQFALLENTFCKVSGFTQQSQSFDHHLNVFEILIEVFGPKRLLWGSDYPVLKETSDYGSWVSITNRLFDILQQPEAALIKSESAKRLYKL